MRNFKCFQLSIVNNSGQCNGNVLNLRGTLGTPCIVVNTYFKLHNTY